MSVSIPSLHLPWPSHWPAAWEGEQGFSGSSGDLGHFGPSYFQARACDLSKSCFQSQISKNIKFYKNPDEIIINFFLSTSCSTPNT
jgi:hypothetical protein